MDGEVYCKNRECARRARLGADVLGRRFRCMYCGCVLPGIAEDEPWGSRTFGPHDSSGDSLERRRRQGRRERPGASVRLGHATCIGRYEIRGLLGSGSCATVYRAFDPLLERDVALKIPHRGAVSGERAEARFLGEAKSLARLRHPGIVPIYEAGRFADLPFIASAYIEGRTLKELLEAGPIPFHRVAEVGVELAEALDYSHGKGVVHRDVKPANVLVEPSGTVHLTDFGLSHRHDAAQLTRAGALIGTPSYIAPEQTASDGTRPHPLADQYSLGVVLYELLCGRPPFLGPPAQVIFSARNDKPIPPRSLRPEIPTGIEKICLRAMARRPADRYRSCLALADALRNWLSEESLDAASSKHTISREVYWFRKKPAVPVASAFNLFGLTASAILATALVVPPSHPETSAAHRSANLAGIAALRPTR